MNTTIPIKYCLRWILTFLLLAEALPAIAGSAASMPRFAPLNPAFLQQQAASPALQIAPEGRSATQFGILLGGISGGSTMFSQHGTGYAPSPANRLHMIGLKPEIARGMRFVSPYPPSFDLRTLGYVTSVKDQGQCGDCWSFSTIASAESNALMSGVGSFDFSENHQNVRHGFDNAACVGGNADIATAYQTRWDNTDTNPMAAGLVFETDDPYTGIVKTSMPGLLPRVHMQEVLALPDRASGSDNDNYKFALQNYGAVDIAMYMASGVSSNAGSSTWNSTTNSYYYHGSAQPNHEVALVGWDDNYSAANFNSTPPGDGAFIVKNQWGTSWGDNGYFYISYYDSKLGDAHVFRTPQGIHNYSHAYLYDPFGMTGSTGYQSDTAYGANVFTAAASETLQAVSIYALTVNTSYEISVYTNVTGTPSTGTLENRSVNTTGAFPYAGHHTVTLSRPVALTAKQKFAIVVRFTTPSLSYPIPVEQPLRTYASSVTAHSGQSYISTDGTTWSDLTTSSPNANVNIRAYTQGMTASIPDAPSISNVSAGNAQVILSFNAPANDGGSPITSYQVISNPGNVVATGSTSPLTVRGLLNGTTYTFTVTATNSAGTSGASAPSDRVTPTLGIQKQSIGVIRFSPITLTVGNTTTVSASATSGLVVSFDSTTPDVCSVNGNTVTGLAAGICTIVANQEGSGNYYAAPQVSKNLTVSKTNQTMSAISFSPATLAIGGITSMSASATSGLFVNFTSATPNICAVSDNSIIPVTPGLCIITANQSGNAYYSAAPQRTKSIIVNLGTQTVGPISITPETLSVKGTATLSAIATSGLPVSFRSTTLRVCVTGGDNGSTVTGLAAGVCTIAATQAGNSNWAHAALVSTRLMVSPQ